MRQTTICLLLCLSLALSGRAAAQGPATQLRHSPMLEGEEHLTFDLRYALGFVDGSVGRATVVTRPTADGGMTTRLLLKSRNAVETFFPMRDTMQTWYGPDRLPVRFYKGINENKFFMRDIVTYSYEGGKVMVKAREYHGDGSIREQRDSEHDAVDTAVLDLISMVAYVRAFPEEELLDKKPHKFIIPLGHDLIQGQFTFLGYREVKYKGQRVSTLEISFDIGDPGFKKNRDNLRICLSRDDRRLPLLGRTELAIGSVDCFLIPAE